MQGSEITFFQALPWPVKNGIHISAERKKIEVEVLNRFQVFGLCGNQVLGDRWKIPIFYFKKIGDALPETNSLHLKIGHPKRKG